MNKITTAHVKAMKNQKKITVLTAYDYYTAQILDKAGIDIILVGDSLGMVMLGYPSTIHVTVSDMIHHAKAVVRATERALVVVDMPFMSYHTSVTDTLKNAQKIIQKSGATCVKLEGGKDIVPQIKALITSGVPVMGHLGLLPQSVNVLGGYKVQAKDDTEADLLIKEALELQNVGVFAIVLECVPASVARKVTAAIDIPTIGIGAGVDCDGQVLVTQDMLGMIAGKKAKFVKLYCDLHNEMTQATKQYIDEVRNKQYPSETHIYMTTNEEGN